MHEMLHDKNCNWNNLPIQLRRGRCVVPKIEKTFVTKAESNNKFEGYVDRTVWVVDNGIPIFTQDRKYIEKFLVVE